MHCGWIQESEWTGERADLSNIIGCESKIDDLPVCPGWLVRQPSVQEGKLAAFALDRCSLAETFPRLEQCVVDAAYVGYGAFKVFENFSLKKNQNK